VINKVFGILCKNVRFMY